MPVDIVWHGFLCNNKFNQPNSVRPSILTESREEKNNELKLPCTEVTMVTEVACGRILSLDGLTLNRLKFENSSHYMLLPGE